MRFVKCAQFTIGLAVGSGLVVVLSGSALAADGGSATTSQKDSVVQTTSSQVDQSAGSTVVSPGSAGGGDPVVTSGKPVPVSQDSLIKGAVGAGSLPQVSGGTDASSATAKQTVAPAESVGRSSVGLDEGAGADVKRNGSDGLAASAEQQAGPVIAVMTPEPLKEPEDGSKMARAIVMRIQPVIRNRAAAFAGDLAAAVPSVTLPARAPRPAQPDGLWSRLRTELAGTVVPQLFLPHVGVLGQTAAELSALIGIVVLVVTGFVFSYGLWLRRGGFANAARSDSPVLAFSFAAPFSLSFVRASALTQSSFFDVFSAGTTYGDVSSP